VAEVPDTPETKTCPDCAESVLAAARKCRFCGYRFDEPPLGAAMSLLERLGVFQRPRTATFQEVLADWGIASAEGEETLWFRVIPVDDQRGYLLVTDRRLVFVADHRRRQETVFEHPIGLVRELSLAGRRLRIRGEGFEHIVSPGTRGVLTELAGHLSAASGVTPDE
jgi:hypothetical protein